MNLFEVYPVISQAAEMMQYKSSYQTNAGDTPYNVTNLEVLRYAIDLVKDIPFVEGDFEALRGSWIFNTTSNSLMATRAEDALAEDAVNTLRIKLNLLKEIAESSNFIGKEDLLFIRLPDFSTFDDLSKISNDFKKAIELPITDDEVGGHVKILAADSGSVILYVALGTILAVTLVAKICRAAFVYRKFNADARIFEAHAKTLELKNEALKALVDAQKVQIKNVLQNEAEAIAAKTYSASNPETIERLKLSIVSVADLVDRGAKILPMGKDTEIKNQFPDYDLPDLITSGIKQITEAS